jgi:HlyD family secretion protein
MGINVVKKGLLLLFVLLCFLSCKQNNLPPDAYGNFEASEVILSAQIQGTILWLESDEGSWVEKGQLLGKIDTVAPGLKYRQLLAQHQVIVARMLNNAAQLAVQEDQRANLLREVDRVRKLLFEQAATQQQFDDLEGKLKVLDAQTRTIRSQQSLIEGERSVLMAQMDETKNLLEKCRITSPLSGTILEKYVEEGELVVAGRALFKIADTKDMELRAYVSGLQLPLVHLGDSVWVQIDQPDGSLRSLRGTVNWVSAQAEFTPKIIQTRQERVDLVYAIRVKVQNDGSIKIGMPGEVRFSQLKHP